MKLLVRSLIYVHDLFGVIKCQTVRHKLVLLLVSIVIVIVYNYWWNVSMACISTVTEKTSFQYYNETEVVDAKNTEVVKLEQSQELDIGKKPKSNKIHYGGVKLNKKLHHDAVQHKDKITDGDTPQKMRYEVYQPDFTYSHPYQGTCKYHVLRKDDRDLKGYIGSYARVRCIPKRPTSGVNIKQYDSGEVLIGKGFPPTLSLQNIRCHAQEITGALYPNARSFRYTGPKIELPKGVPFNVNKTMFAIECKNTKNLTVYSNAYVNFAKEKVSRHQKRSRFTSQDQFSVNILVLDSTSRNQFYRHAPKSLKFMKENGFKILFGYNKVADNSAVNLLPILSGRTIAFGANNTVPTKLRFSMRDLISSRYEKEMIIKKVKALNYTTMWNDDIMVTKLGLFSYGHFKGFSKPPADYYFRSFYSYMYGRKSARRHCVDGEFATSRFLKIWKNFALNFKNSKHFGFTFLTALTHDDPAAVGLLDNKIKVSLEELKHSGAFENTIYIIMGDHGHRIRAIQKTYTGRIEERMPLFSIRFPDRFQKLYPEKAAKFTENSNRFVSNYDIHQTLNDILFGSYNAKSVDPNSRFFEYANSDSQCEYKRRGVRPKPFHFVADAKMPTNRLFSSKIRLFLVLLVLYDVGQVFANFEVRLKPNCEMEQDSTVKTMTTGACSHTQAVIMEGDARLLINVASPTSLKFSTVYLRNLTPEATTIKFENTVDLEHVLGEACKFKKEKFTAFADWHMVYVSAICKNAQGKSVHAFVRSIVYSEYLIHTPPSYVVYTNIPESSDLAGVGALTGYRETARLIEYNNKLNKSMIFVRLLNNVNSTTPVQTHPSLFDNTTEAADTPVGEITKIINVGLTEANAGQITVYMTTKNDGYFVTSRTFLDKPLKLVDRDDCATKNPLSGDITAYFCFKDEFEKEKGKEVYKWRSDLILNDVLMPDLSYECGNTQAGVDFEKCKSDVAKRSFWCILLFVLAGIEFLIITATMLTFVGCICHRRRKIKKHRKRKGRHGKNKKKEDSNGSKASNTKKTGSAESAVSNADTKNTTNDKNTTSEAKK